MFQRLQENPPINGIMCVPYSNLILNDNTRQRCTDVFGNNIPNESVIVYSPSDDGIVVLGYYVLSNEHMADSECYEYLRARTITLQGEDPTEEIRKFDCICISEWVFDYSLRSRNHLESIFNSIVSGHLDGSRHFIWYVNRNRELLFYSIYNRMSIDNTAAVIYFANEFLNE